MKNYITFILILFASSISWSQSINEVVKESTIQNTFDKATIQSYSVQANTKVDELFEYLNLMNENNNSLALEHQLIENISQLFIDKKTIPLIDFENSKLFFTVQDWLNQIKKSTIKFESWKLINSKLKDNYWRNSYQLIYIVNGNKTTQKIDIQIFFYLDYKSFGKTDKKVWDIKLGEVKLAIE